MKTKFISINDFCSSLEIEQSFLIELSEYELLKLKLIGNQQFIYVEELAKVEKMVRLHHDLKINLEGIEAIYHLLERTQRMQDEIQLLKNRLKKYGEI